MAVDPLFDILLDLDRLEMDRMALDCAVGDLPSRREHLEKELHARTRHLHHLQQQIEKHEQELYAASHQVIARTAEINRLQESFCGSMPNREYEALHASILHQQELLATHAARQSVLRAELETLRETLSQQQPAHHEFLAQAQASLHQLELEIAELAARRRFLAEQYHQRLAQLPEEHAKEWNRLARARAEKKQQGTVRHLVYSMQENDACCKNCYTELTRHTVRCLKEPCTVLNCPSCGAFLISQNPSEKRLA